jgi:hypothetical protein
MNAVLFALLIVLLLVADARGIARLHERPRVGVGFRMYQSLSDGWVRASLRRKAKLEKDDLEGVE